MQNTRDVHSHQWRVSKALSPTWHFPTRSHPYGSFRHIVLDVIAGNTGKVPIRLSFNLVHPAYHRHYFKRASRQRKQVPRKGLYRREMIWANLQRCG
ncbi:hypothetical protein NOF04DRAFT_1172411 [Fusarium oxysporum II5]|nr:hypothetical protein NOF04DRAFT_1172411 [Fusarium oxysporum II5]